MVFTVRLFAVVDLTPSPFETSVVVKTDTNQDDPASDVRLAVGGWYNDGGGDQWYYSDYSFGAGENDWVEGWLGIPGHLWLEGYPDVYVEIWRDTGYIWIDEFSVMQYPGERNINPHFNLGWNSLKKHPKYYVGTFSDGSGGFKLRYGHDVP